MFWFLYLRSFRAVISRNAVEHCPLPSTQHTLQELCRVMGDVIILRTSAQPSLLLFLKMPKISWFLGFYFTYVALCPIALGCCYCSICCCFMLYLLLLLYCYCSCNCFTGIALLLLLLLYCSCFIAIAIALLLLLLLYCSCYCFISISIAIALSLSLLLLLY